MILVGCINVPLCASAETAPVLFPHLAFTPNGYVRRVRRSPVMGSLPASNLMRHDDLPRRVMLPLITRLSLRLLTQRALPRFAIVAYGLVEIVN